VPAEGVTPAQLLLLAASAEQLSKHPAARALVSLARDVNMALQKPDSFSEASGKGVIVSLSKEKIVVGRKLWLEENGVVFNGAECLDIDENEGWSLVFVAKDSQYLGCIGLRDQPRMESRECLEQLKRIGIRRITLVSGDRKPVAQSVAHSIGCEEIVADCLPQDKVEYVKQMRDRGYRVAVVGDGVNDAPALAAGDLSIAMGAAGSDVAVHSASIALMNNDLRRIPFLIQLSHRTRTIINQNFLLGLIFVIGGLFLAATKYISPIIAAVVHVAGSLIVVFNSFRLIRFGEELESFDGNTTATNKPTTPSHTVAKQAGAVATLTQ
jgi:Cd2+/Zn2+-exporting ATPase